MGPHFVGTIYSTDAVNGLISKFWLYVRNCDHFATKG